MKGNEMETKYQVSLINDYGNPVVYFTGTLEDCNKFLDKNIEYLEERGDPGIEEVHPRKQRSG